MALSLSVFLSLSASLDFPPSPFANLLIVNLQGVVKVMVPKIVKWFGQDYGKDKYEQLRFIVRHLEESTPRLDYLKAALRPYDNKLKVSPCFPFLFSSFLSFFFLASASNYFIQQIAIESLPYDPIFLCDLSQVVGRFGTNTTKFVYSLFPSCSLFLITSSVSSSSGLKRDTSNLQLKTGSMRNTFFLVLFGLAYSSFFFFFFFFQHCDDNDVFGGNQSGQFS